MMPKLLKWFGLSVTVVLCMHWEVLHAQVADNTTVSIHGIVRDGETGEPLPFAHVQIAGTQSGMACDEDGRFVIHTSHGSRTLLVSYIGYLTGEFIAEDAEPMEIKLLPASALSSEVVITASQRSQYIHLAPASIAVVSQKEITERQIATFDQAFEQVTGIEVTRSSGSNVQAFSIRGASEVAGGGIGNRVLLLIDGRPAISPESGGALWNLVPMGAIERIEVVKGAYSSLYGSSAMGGVVNVITRTPASEPSTHVHINYGMYNRAPRYTGYTRIGDFNTVSYSRSHASGRFSYLLDLARRQDDGHREKSGYTLYNGFTKLRYALSQHRTFHLSANLNQILNDTPASWLGPLMEYSVAPHRRDDYQNRREWNIDFQYRAIANAHTKYESRFYFYDNYSRFTFNDDPGNDSTNINFGKQDVDRTHVRARRLGNVTQLDRAIGTSHYVIAGIDLKYDWIDGVPDTVLYGMHQAVSTGIYVQDEATWGKLTATAGVRYDYYGIVSQFSECNVSPKLSALYSISENLSFRMLLAQAFRNPSIAERFIKFEQGGGLRFVPNPDLRAERLVFSAEAGSRIRLSPRFDIDAAVFYNRYRDLISYQQVATQDLTLVFRVINLTHAVMQGAECMLRYTIPGKASVQAGYTYLDARDTSPGRFNDALAYKVRHTLQFSATGYYKRLTANVNGRYRSAIEEVFIYPGSEPDANMLLHAKLSYRLHTQHHLYAAVNNLFNTQYEELERYRMAGRSYTAGAVLKF